MGLELLRAFGLRTARAVRRPPCPACRPHAVDVAGVAQQVEERLETFYREHPDAPRPHVADGLFRERPKR